MIKYMSQGQGGELSRYEVYGGSTALGAIPWVFWQGGRSILNKTPAQVPNKSVIGLLGIL